MDIKSLAVGLLAKKLSGNQAGGNDAIGKVMSGLLGGGEAGSGGFDIASLVNGLKEKGHGDVAESWLGDGENAEISADQIKEVLGQEKIQAAAAELGTDEGSLLDGLKDAIPQMVDKSSSGGSLLDAVGGVSGLAGIAKKLF